MDKITLVEDFPARIAGMLLKDEIDIGLVPVAILPQMKEWHIITDYGIGAVGEVASVAIFSEVPMEQVTRVLLDYQSRTSVNLARILLKEYWQKAVVFEEAKEDFRKEIGGTTAGVVIGDRALEQRKISAYTYDLSSAWLAHTGLPFLFAAWVANKSIDPDFIDAFNRATGFGVSHIQEVINGFQYPNYDLHTYYTSNISYQLDEAKRKGLALFLDKLGKY